MSKWEEGESDMKPQFMSFQSSVVDRRTSLLKREWWRGRKWVNIGMKMTQKQPFTSRTNLLMCFSFCLIVCSLCSVSFVTGEKARGAKEFPIWKEHNSPKEMREKRTGRKEWYKCVNSKSGQTNDQSSTVQVELCRESRGEQGENKRLMSTQRTFYSCFSSFFSVVRRRYFSIHPTFQCGLFTSKTHTTGPKWQRRMYTEAFKGKDEWLHGQLEVSCPFPVSFSFTISFHPDSPFSLSSPHPFSCSLSTGLSSCRNFIPKSTSATFSFSLSLCVAVSLTQQLPKVGVKMSLGNRHW